jgi:hypothetical protein
MNLIQSGHQSVGSLLEKDSWEGYLRKGCGNLGYYCVYTHDWYYQFEGVEYLRDGCQLEREIIVDPGRKEGQRLGVDFPSFAKKIYLKLKKKKIIIIIFFAGQFFGCGNDFKRKMCKNEKMSKK